jgi:hypothetical protein
MVVLIHDDYTSSELDQLLHYCCGHPFGSASLGAVAPINAALSAGVGFIFFASGAAAGADVCCGSTRFAGAS